MNGLQLTKKIKQEKTRYSHCHSNELRSAEYRESSFSIWSGIVFSSNHLSSGIEVVTFVKSIQLKKHVLAALRKLAISGRKKY